METVLVVGGSKGIGKAIVEELSAQYNVAFTYNKSKASAMAIEKAYPSAKSFFCDVESSASIESLKQDCLKRFGKIHHIVYSAGIAEYKLFIDIDESSWLKMQNVNLNGLYRILSTFAPDMISRKVGTITAISSVWGQAGASMESHYSASKAGMIGLVKSLAKEYAPSGVRVNCICPGAIQTDMIKNIDSESLCENIPLGFVGSPKDVALGVLFLLNSNYITGHCLTIDGGLSL